MTYRECYEYGSQKLKDSDVPEAELNARLLLEFVCDTNRNTLLVNGNREVTESEREKYEQLLLKRGQRIPLQHLTGVQNFMGLDFAVNEHVLIPRQDTEILVEEVLKNLHDGMRILDMCTGSGCILVSILHYSNDCSGVGVDISPKALSVARQNAGELLPKERLPEFIESDLFAQIPADKKFEVIVSNPPYIEKEVIDTLMPEVKEHEPIAALDGGIDGLDFYRQIIDRGSAYLCGGGMLFFEIGYNQGEAVKKMMEDSGYKEVQIVKDYAGLDRVVFGIL